MKEIIQDFIEQNKELKSQQNKISFLKNDINRAITEKFKLEEFIKILNEHFNELSDLNYFERKAYLDIRDTYKIRKINKIYIKRYSMYDMINFYFYLKKPNDKNLIFEINLFTKESEYSLPIYLCIDYKKIFLIEDIITSILFELQKIIENDKNEAIKSVDNLERYHDYLQALKELELNL